MPTNPLSREQRAQVQRALSHDEFCKLWDKFTPEQQSALKVIEDSILAWRQRAEQAEHREARLREALATLVREIYKLTGDPDECDDCADIDAAGERSVCALHSSTALYQAVLAAEGVLGPCEHCQHARAEHHDEDTTRCKACDCPAFRLPALAVSPVPTAGEGT